MLIDAPVFTPKKESSKGKTDAKKNKKNKVVKPATFENILNMVNGNNKPK